VWILDGTPIGEKPLDLYSKANIMDPRIFGAKNYTEFRARYAVMKHLKPFPKITRWQNLEDLQQRFAPYILRRLKKDCMDLPPKLEPVTLTVALTPETWAVYKQMKEDMIAWLDIQTVSVATLAVVKALRLAQVCSGFLGGLEEPKQGAKTPAKFSKLPKYLEKYMDKEEKTEVISYGNPYAEYGVREIGREKLDLLIDWVNDRLAEDPEFKLIIWCRFRPELERLKKASFAVPAGTSLRRGYIHGGQEKLERTAALRLLKPETAPPGPVIFAGTTRTGSLGLDLSAASYVLHSSYDYSLVTRMQADDRPHRTGQTKSIWYGDIVATGPKGQKTVDHTIIKALREKRELAMWTCRAWITALTEESED
jgi:Superfamily II DNA/RNA helicases, SNF2 family